MRARIAGFSLVELMVSTWHRRCLGNASCAALPSVHGKGEAWRSEEQSVPHRLSAECLQDRVLQLLQC